MSILRLLALAAVLIIAPALVNAATTNQISQYGITWMFDKAYTYGQFANGDYWVIGPVTITSITPAFSGGRNGWTVNPLPSSMQGFDSRAGYYSSSVIPSLPYTANPGSSIVKTISLSSPQAASCGYNYLQTAAVLTVVSAAPPDNGATVFRPPYVGTSKPYYSINSIRWSLVPSLALVANAPSLSYIASRLGRIQLDHINPDPSMGGGVPNCELNPVENMKSYGPDVANENNDAILRLMLNDGVSAKTPAMIAVIQGGIDRYYAAINGQTWPPGAGYEQGRKISIAFAGVMLDDSGMKDLVRNSDFFFEDTTIQVGYHGTALFGDRGSWPGSSPNYENYWNFMKTDPGYNLDYPDPYGFIDGGMNYARISGYQYCCTSMSFKGSALAALLIPEIKQNWGRQEFFDYVDRYVTHGVLTQPDPCAPMSQGGGPKSNGECVLDPDLTAGSTMQSFSCQAGKKCGRFPDNDGINADTGGYTSAFTNSMWTAYRGLVSSAINGSCGTAKRVYAQGETFPGAYTICSAGMPPTTTPTLGASVGAMAMWTCAGQNGGTSASCNATRSSTLNGVCGPAAKAYSETETFPAGVYCSYGTAYPSSPANPAVGSSTSWTCAGSNGGTNATCTASRATVPTAGLVGYWALNEGSGTTTADGSGNGYTGTLNGPMWTTGKIGGALSFDGSNDEVDTTLSAPANSFTFGAWVKASSTHEIDTQTTNDCSSGGCGGTSGQKYAFGAVHRSGSDAGTGLSVGTNGVSVYEHGDNYMPATLVYSANIGTGWTHVVVVYNNKQPTLYINGTAVRTGLTSPRSNVYAPINFGCGEYGCFSGAMDEVRVYNRALSASEVQQVYLYSGASLNYHPADTDKNWALETPEVSTYNLCWKTPTCTPSPATTYVSNANLMWKSRADGAYHYDSSNSCPLCWVSGP